jgi:hypothetical protein
MTASDRRAPILLALLVWSCTSSPDQPAVADGGSPVAPAGGNSGGAGTGGSPGVDRPAPANAPDTAAPAAVDAAAPVALDAGGAGMPPAPTGPARIVLVAGGNVDADGIPATQARLAEPFGAVTDPLTGEIYIAELASNRIRRIDPAGTIHTVVGPGAPGAAGNVDLDRPHDLLFQPGTRNLFIADTMNSQVWRLDAGTGEVKLFAGAGSPVAPGLRNTYCLAFDRAGRRLFVTNSGGGRIEIIDLTSLAVTSVATPSPRVVTVDSRDNLYVVQGGGMAIKRLDLMGRTTNLPGAVDAPKRLAVDADDNVLIADTESDRVRKLVVATGTIVPVAGGAAGAGTLGGPPEQAGLNRPHGVFEDEKRRLIIADSGNNRVLRIER